MEYMKQVMIDMGKDSYKGLKELSYNREAWITAANQSNDWSRKEDCESEICYDALGSERKNK